MRRLTLFMRVLLSLLLVTALFAGKRVEPVAAVAPQGFRISTAQGSGVVPVVSSLDWSKPQPKITRVVIVFHGKGRDVEGYYHTAMEAADMAGAKASETTVVAPQFLDEEDVAEHHLPADVLRWRRTDWESGAPALAPLPLSSFEVVDNLLARLDDPKFPNLKNVVLAGHSGGGQLLQRYAVVGRELAVLGKSGIHVRFVVANPSSYVYFSDERPVSKGGGVLPFKSDTCGNFNRWKYGTLDPPDYVKVDADHTWQQMEAAYAQRDVIYLLGTADTDPHEKDLDVSCSGEAQGPSRFARGQSYYAYLHSRHRSDWNQRMWFVPDVAHSAHKMFTSQCGIAAIFDAGHCTDQTGEGVR